MLDQPVPNPLAKNPNFNTHKVFAAIGIILIAAILILAGTWIYVENQSGTKSTDSEDNTVKVSTSSAKKATKSAEKDETENWKPYTNAKLKFSLKYPQDWLTNSCEETSFFFAPTKETLGICASEFGGLVGIFYIDSNYPDYTSTETFKDISFLDNPKKIDTLVAGREAIKISGIYKESGGAIVKGDKIIRYFVNLNSKVLYINYYQKVGWSDFSKEFELMVSTFKFLD